MICWGGGPAGASGGARGGVGVAGAGDRWHQGGGEAGPDAGEDRGAAGAPRGGGAVPDAGPVRGGGVRVLVVEVAAGDGAGDGPAAGPGGAGRFRVPGDDRRRCGAAAEAAGAGVHRGDVAVLLRVPVVLADDGRGDRRVRGGVGVLRGHVPCSHSGQPEAGGGRGGPDGAAVEPGVDGVHAGPGPACGPGAGPVAAGQTSGCILHLFGAFGG